ncbi:MAG: hypothetical protein EHM34_04905 [Nitrosopumilales archaeon]|nr:MAG: hypothetical protein EHM34_04905 [Nitrosopumilales archaeon]
MAEMVGLVIYVRISDEWIEDLICTIIEGGSGYWINHVKIHHPNGDKPKGVPTSTWVSDALNKGGFIDVYERNDDFRSTELPVMSGILTKEKLIDGIKQWVAKRQEQIKSIDREGDYLTINGDIDANEADCIMQYAIYNDIIFG